MKAINFLIIILLGTIMIGCSSLGKVQMEVLRPPTASIELANQKISIANGFLQKNVKNKSDFKNLVKYDKYRLDSLISVESIFALQQILVDAGSINVDVVDSLGKMKVGGSYLSIDKVDIRSEVETEPMYVHSKGAYYAAVRVPYEILWSINTTKGKELSISFNDTLWAEGYAYAFDKLADLVQFDNVIEYIISKTTFELARKISPVWEETTRYYFKSSNNDFLRAAYFMDNKQYDEAALIWQKYSENSKGSVASRAFLNLAVYHELKGDINEAIIFCQKSVDLKNELAVKYLKVLQQRQKEVNKILKGN
jgi:tetratricopeptide (TPR) repeat protein